MINPLIYLLCFLLFIFYFRIEIVFQFIYFIQYLLLKYDIKNRINLITEQIRNILKIIKQIYSNEKFKLVIPNVELLDYSNNMSNLNKQTIIILNGGTFIGNDSFDILISDNINLKYPNHQILYINTLKNVSFDLILNDLKNTWTQLEIKSINIVKIYAHSSGCGLILALSKYFRLPELILVSPFIGWNIQNIPKNHDIILYPNIIQIIKEFKFNIRDYLNMNNINDIKFFVGGNEILLTDVQSFSQDNNIKDITIIPNKPHGLNMWILYSDFDINLII